MLRRNRLFLPRSDFSSLLGSVLHPWRIPVLLCLTIPERRALEQARSETQMISVVPAFKETLPVSKGCVWGWVTLELRVPSGPAFGGGGGSICGDSGEKVTAGKPWHFISAGRTGELSPHGLAAAQLYLGRYTADCISLTPSSIALLSKTRFANSLSANAFRKRSAGNKERSPCLRVHSHFCAASRPFFYPVQLRDVSWVQRLLRDRCTCVSLEQQD